MQPGLAAEARSPFEENLRAFAVRVDAVCAIRKHAVVGLAFNVGAFFVAAAQHVSSAAAQADHVGSAVQNQLDDLVTRAADEHVAPLQVGT